MAAPIKKAQSAPAPQSIKTPKSNMQKVGILIVVLAFISGILS